MFEYVGVIHIHSSFSDGSGEISEIAGYANECDLDFAILTDHNTLRALKEGFERWFGRTLLLVGCELNDKENKNHYLAFGINETFSTRLPAKEYVRKVKESGGIGFLAHPHEKRSSMKEHPSYPWTEWDTEDFTGIEIWNHMSEWMEGLTEQNKYNYFVHPLRSIVSPPAETLKVWDQLSLKRRVVGIGGADAHAHKINVLGFVEMEVFPYKVLFKSIRTHIVTEEKLSAGDSNDSIGKSKENVYKSLSEGRCFTSNFYHGDARGFRFFAQEGEKEFQMGSLIDFTEKTVLKVTVPATGCSIKILCNGEVKAVISGKNATFDVKEKGAYRVEVFKDQNAWIFSNHIRIGL